MANGLISEGARHEAAREWLLDELHQNPSIIEGMSESELDRVLAAFDIDVGSAIADVQNALPPLSQDERECLELVDFLGEQDIDSSSEEDLDIFLAALDVDLGPALQKVLEVQESQQLLDFREWAAAVAVQQKRLSSWHGNAIGRASGCSISAFKLLLCEPMSNTAYGRTGGATLVAESGNVTIFCATRSTIWTLELVAGSGNDTLVAGSGNDTLFLGGTHPGAGNDTFVGGAGNNTLVAGSGNDTLFLGGTHPGAGNNTFVGGAGNNTLVAGSGNDTLFLGGTHPGAGSITFVGGSGNDTLVAGSGNDTLVGRACNVTLAGRAGNNTFVGGAGNDTFVGRACNVTLAGKAGNVMFVGGIGATTLVAGARNVTIFCGNLVGEEPLVAFFKPRLRFE